MRKSSRRFSNYSDSTALIFGGSWPIENFFAVTENKGRRGANYLILLTCTPTPQFGQLVPLFLDVKNNVLARNTKPRNDDYNNDVSDNCDHNFGTFDDLVLKMTKKYNLT